MPVCRRVQARRGEKGITLRTTKVLENLRLSIDFLIWQPYLLSIWRLEQFSGSGICRGYGVALLFLRL